MIQIIGSDGTLATLLPLFIPALSTLLSKFENKDFNLFISFGMIVGLLPPLLIDDEAIGYFLIASNVFASVGVLALVQPADSLVNFIQNKREEVLFLVHDFNKFKGKIAYFYHPTKNCS